MTIKRYGYRFEKFDGEMTRSIDLRFWTVIYAFFAAILTLIHDGGGFAASYIGLAFFYLLFSFIPEVFPRVKNYPVLIPFAVIMYFLYVNQGEMFQSSERVKTPDGWITQYNDGFEVMVIYCVYNILVAITALVGCLPKKKANKAIQH